MVDCNVWSNVIKNSTSANCSNYEGAHQESCDTFQTSVRCLRDSRTLSIVITVATLYLLLVTVLFELTNRKRPEVTAASRIYLLSVLLCFTHAGTMLLHAYGAALFDDCTAHDIILNSSYIGSTLTVYTLFWVRQRRFHMDPLLRSTNTKFMRALSVLVIIGVYTTVPGLVIAFHTSHCMVLSKNGCVPVPQTGIGDEYVIACSVTFMVLSLLFKALLLALIIHPLVKNGEARWRDCLIQCGQGKGSDIRCLVRRLAVCMLACTVSTLAAGVAVSLMATGVLCNVWEPVGSLDLLAINIATVCSFADGAKRLCPVLAIRKVQRRKDSKDSSAHGQI